jgi:hypothetical protein
VPLPAENASNLNPTAAGWRLFNALKGQLIGLGVDLPKRQGFLPGAQVVWDGESFTFALAGILRGMPGQVVEYSQPPQLTTLFYDFEVNLLRKTPVPGSSRGTITPDQRKLTTNAETVADDAVALMNAIVAVHSDYLVVPPGIPFGYSLMTVGPEGELVGVRLAVEFQAGHAVDGTY